MLRAVRCVIIITRGVRPRSPGAERYRFLAVDLADQATGRRRVTCSPAVPVPSGAYGAGLGGDNGMAILTFRAPSSMFESTVKGIPGRSASICRQ